MLNHFVVFYNNITGDVEKIIPSINFTNGSDNIANYCKELDTRIILGVLLDDELIYGDCLQTIKVVREDKISNESLKVIINDKEKIIYNNNNIKNKDLIIDGDIFSGTGYGMLTREFLKRLINTDLNFYINPINSGGLFKNCLSEEDNVFQSKIINTSKINKYNGDYIHMRIYPPRINFPRKTFALTYTMLESYTIQHMYIKMIEASFDRFIVPTNFVKNVFSKYMSKDRISVVPLGIDQKVFHPKIKQEDVCFKKINLGSKSMKITDEVPTNFRFLSTARFSHRKGCDLVLKSFANEFDRTKDDVSLVLFYLPENENNPLHLHSRIISILSQYDANKIPPIYLVDNPWPTNKQYLPYGWGDCFVFPSRGEGFGLTPMEAGACKIPIICSNNSGLSDFITEDNAFVIPCDKVENIGTVGLKGYEGNHKEWIEDVFHPHTHDCEFPIMNDQNTIDIIGKHMRYVYENPYSKEVNSKVENMYKLINEKYTWDIVSQQLYNELRNIIG